jgi:hypothetical protein
MSDTTGEALLDRLRARLEIESGFVSHDLARWRTVVGEPPPLTGGSVAWQRLALCRSPRRGADFAADVAAVSAHAGIDVAELARFYRLLDAEEGFAASRPVASAVLAAARDVAEEEVTRVDVRAAGAAIARGALPGWLSTVVDRFWRSHPPVEFPRDLELHVLLNLPLAVIEVADLTVDDVRARLGPEASGLLARLPNRRVHACLLAYAGVGIIFVDATDEPPERRLNLAHEAAHFLLDYLLIRERLAAHDPALLDVMDGLRPATAQEELGALLADVPLGVQTHLLERDAAGGHVARSTSVVEDRAEMVAWELLAPRAAVLAVAAERDVAALTSMLEDQFGLPGGVATAYGAFLARLATPRGDSWLNFDD